LNKHSVYGSFRESDCLSLLVYASKHRTDMSPSALAVELNIPTMTLFLIIYDGLEHKAESRLAACAEHWHYDFKIDPKALVYGKGPREKRVVIIDAVWRGY
jgi:hypothetical protein